MLMQMSTGTASLRYENVSDQEIQELKQTLGSN